MSAPESAIEPAAESAGESGLAALPLRLPRVPRWRGLLSSLAFAREPIANLDRLHATHGDTVGVYLGGVRFTILTRDPALMQHVLQKNHRAYHKSDITHGLIRYVGRGLLTNDGPDWLRQRRLIQPGFNRLRLRGLVALMQGSAEHWSQQLRARLPAAPGPPLTIDMHAEMTRVAFDVVARATFGTGLPEVIGQQLSEILGQIQVFYLRTIRQPYLQPWLRLRGQYRHHDALTQELRALVRGLIRQRQAAPAPEPAPDDLLQLLLEARYEDTGAGMNEDQLLDETIILLLAGHETSANALSWLFYELARHPGYVAQIRQQRAAAGLVHRAPEFDELPQLPGALHAVQEALRLYPPAWILDRVALEADDFRGLPIPKGTLFSLYLYGLHRHPAYWVEPTAFRPERFAPGHEPPVPALAYLPFGSGPRLCVGNHFALTEMQVVVLEALRHFDFALATTAPLGLNPLITLRPKGPVWLAVRPAGATSET